MPVRSTNQSSFFSPTFLDPGCVEVGGVPWLLWRQGTTLLPAWMASEWRGHVTTSRSAGRAAWPARALFALHVLRWSEQGCSRLGACRRARTDIAWRAAMGLEVGGDTPTESTMRDFEAWLRDRALCCDLPRYLVLHEHLVRIGLGLVKSAPLVAVDSTPMWCFGALRGTIRLLGDGLRGLGKRLARRTDLSLAELARRWSVPWLLSRSMKGGLTKVDWRSSEERSAATDGIVRTVLEAVRDAKKLIRDQVDERYQEWFVQRCAAILQVITDDLEEDDAGRLVVARRVARDCIVSITDPEARSGRKTRSQPFKGFRLHVLGDVVSGLVLAVDVVAANTHDALVGESLIGRAKELIPELDQVLADTAYGATSVRVRLALEGVDLVAPPQMPSKKSTDTLKKEDFMVDFERRVATCPAGRESIACEDAKAADDTVLQFRWSRSACASCPLRARCTPRTRAAGEPVPKRGRLSKVGKRLRLHPLEQALRAARAQWKTPERRSLYRRRTEVELLIANAVRAGGRQARAWGLQAAVLQAHSIAIHLNLAVIARELAQE